MTKQIMFSKILGTASTRAIHIFFPIWKFVVFTLINNEIIFKFPIFKDFHTSKCYAIIDLISI